MTDTTVTEVPEDLVALELARRQLKADYEAQPEHRRCRYALYGAEQKLAAHPWLVARKADWRTARKTLKQAANDAVAF